LSTVSRIPLVASVPCRRKAAERHGARSGGRHALPRGNKPGRMPIPQAARNRSGEGWFVLATWEYTSACPVSSACCPGERKCSAERREGEEGPQSKPAFHPRKLMGPVGPGQRMVLANCRTVLQTVRLTGEFAKPSYSWLADGFRHGRTRTPLGPNRNTM